MRWAALFVILSGVTLVGYLIRGVYRGDGLAFLVLVFLAAAVVAGVVAHVAERAEMDRKYPR